MSIESNIKVATGVIEAGETSETISAVGSVISVDAHDATTGDKVLIDAKHTVNGITASIAQAYANDIQITVLYLAASAE